MKIFNFLLRILAILLIITLWNIKVNATIFLYYTSKGYINDIENHGPFTKVPIEFFHNEESNMIAFTYHMHNRDVYFILKKDDAKKLENLIKKYYKWGIKKYYNYGITEYHKYNEGYMGRRRTYYRYGSYYAMNEDKTNRLIGSLHISVIFKAPYFGTQQYIDKDVKMTLNFSPFFLDRNPSINNNLLLVSFDIVRADSNKYKFILPNSLYLDHEQALGFLKGLDWQRMKKGDQEKHKAKKKGK